MMRTVFITHTAETSFGNLLGPDQLTIAEQPVCGDEMRDRVYLFSRSALNANPNAGVQSIGSLAQKLGSYLREKMQAAIYH